jgi:DNA-binding FrmR family transcriptional regulator
MVEEDRGCVQVLKQIAPTSGALHSLAEVLLEDHLKGCVANAIQNQSDTTDLIEQVVEIFKKFNK